MNCETITVEDSSSVILPQQQQPEFTHDSFPTIAHIKYRMRRKLKLDEISSNVEKQLLHNSS